MRSQPITVFDLHKILGIKSTSERDGKTRILLLRNVDQVFGVIVDQIIELSEIADNEIQPLRTNQTDIPPLYLAGVWTKAGKKEAGSSVLILSLSGILESLVLEKYSK